jgi:hypothetical protein
MRLEILVLCINIVIFLNLSIHGLHVKEKNKTSKVFRILDYIEKFNRAQEAREQYNEMMSHKLVSRLKNVHSVNSRLR